MCHYEWINIFSIWRGFRPAWILKRKSDILSRDVVWNYLVKKSDLGSKLWEDKAEIHATIFLNLLSPKSFFFVKLTFFFWWHPSFFSQKCIYCFHALLFHTFSCSFAGTSGYISKMISLIAPSLSWSRAGCRLDPLLLERPEQFLPFHSPGLNISNRRFFAKLPLLLLNSTAFCLRVGVI